MPPLTIATATDPQDRTDPDHQMMRLLSPDKRVLHLDSCAKYFAAFFHITLLGNPLQFASEAGKLSGEFGLSAGAGKRASMHRHGLLPLIEPIAGNAQFPRNLRRLALAGIQELHRLPLEFWRLPHVAPPPGLSCLF